MYEAFSLKLLVYEALSLKLLVYETLSQNLFFSNRINYEADSTHSMEAPLR